MTYNHNIITREQKRTFVERKESRSKIFFYGIIVVLLTSSLHFMLQALVRSVLPIVLPQLMMPGYLSTLSLYIATAFILYTAYIIRYYGFLTYAEISQDKWYTLTKDGYVPHRTILVRPLMRLSEVIAYYIIGFPTTLFLTMFLKYPFIVSYILPLYICGLIDLIFLSPATMSTSLFISRQRNARYVIIIGAVCVWMLQLQCGYCHLISDRTWMSTPRNLLDLLQCSYLLYFVIMIILCVLVVVLRAKRVAQCANLPLYEQGMDMGKSVNIVVLQEDGYHEVEEQYVCR